MIATLRFCSVRRLRRHFSDSTLRKSHSLMFNVEKFGALQVNIGSTDLVIDMIDCQKYPDQNVAFLQCEKVEALKNLNAEWKQNILHINGKAPLMKAESKKLSATVQVPVKFNVSVESKRDENVTVQNLQNESVDATLNDGHCSLSNLLTDRVKVSTANGDIKCSGTLHTNGIFAIRNSGNFFAKKIIGESLQIKVDTGDVKISSSYVENSSISTNLGNIVIGQAHKMVNLNIHEKGNVIIDSLDGNANINVNEGDVKIFAYKHENVSLNIKKGNAKVYLPEDCKTNLNIESNELEIEKTLNILKTPNDENRKGFQGSMNCTGDAGVADALISITAREGKVSIGRRSWEDIFLKMLKK